MTRRCLLCGIISLVIITVVGCGVPYGQLRIRGEYAHLDQADFLLYSTDAGMERVDTIHIRQGEFEFLTALSRNATFHILYPNGDELALWAHNGDDVVISGDAQSLSKVSVKGNEENELYSEFRQQYEPGDTVAIRRLAAAFIRQHPVSAVSLYLLEKHFLHAPDVLPSDSVRRLYQVLRKAQPRNNEVALLGGRIQQRYALQKGKAVPDFSLTTVDSVKHSLSDYKGHQLLLYFWAGWIGSSHGTHRVIADSLESRSSLRALSYSLDVDTLTFNVTHDSTLNIPVYCDYQGFQGTLVKQLGITQLPMAVLVDERGRIKMADTELSKVMKQLK